MPISGQVGGGLPVTGSSGPLADGEENLDRGKGVVGGPQAGNQTHRGHVPRLSTAFTLALHAYSHPAHGGGGFLPAAVMTTIGDEGTVLGDRIWGAEKGAVRRGSGAQGVAVSTGPAEHEHGTCWGQEGGRVGGGPTRPGTWSPGAASSPGLLFRVHPCPGRPSALPCLTGPSWWQCPQTRCLGWNVRCKRPTQSSTRPGVYKPRTPGPTLTKLIPKEAEPTQQPEEDFTN